MKFLVKEVARWFNNCFRWCFVSKKARRNWRRFMIWLIALVLLALFGFVAMLFANESWNFTSCTICTKTWAEFGSFIGALLLAATLIYQVRAFHRQQVEAKFFELIRYYRDNITEMRFRNPFYYEEDKGKAEKRKVDEEFVSGRRVMKTIFEQYKVARKIAKEFEPNKSYKVPETIYNTIIKSYTKKGWMQSPEKTKWVKQFVINEIAYLITFWGIPGDIDTELKNHLSRIVAEGKEDDLIIGVRGLVTVYELEDGTKEYSSFLKSSSSESSSTYIKKEGDIIEDGKIKFFGGHQYHLGHFFRHLYQAVKYIDEQPSWLFSQAKKYDYVKTLRAQMSNYEQALLFINSLTQLGRRWEYENEYGKELISKYHLIKNLPQCFINKDMEPHHFYPKVDFEWKTRYLSNLKSKDTNEIPEP